MKKSTQKPKHVPERRCTGCGESFPKKNLIRVVRSPEGEVSIDFTGRKNGRGAYICPNTACFKKAKKSGRIARSLETAVSEEMYRILEEEVAAAEADLDKI